MWDSKGWVLCLSRSWCADNSFVSKALRNTKSRCLRVVRDILYLYSRKNKSLLTNYLVEVQDAALYEETPFNKSFHYWLTKCNAFCSRLMHSVMWINIRSDSVIEQLEVHRLRLYIQICARHLCGETNSLKGHAWAVLVCQYLQKDLWRHLLSKHLSA